MTIKFSATKLTGTGKRGILKPDEDGYYEMVVGGLNVFNSAGEYYTLKGAEQLFSASSIFMRRVKSGCLKAEVGHPKKLPSMAYRDYVQRIFAIEETNICAHFKEIWLDPTFGVKNPQANNPNLVAIMAKVKPTGPKASGLQAAFDNPHENVCFSIRAVTKDYFERGQCCRVLENIVTFDWVNEPGISIANKWDSPAMESINSQILTKEAVQSVLGSADEYGIATEDSRAMVRDVLRVFEPRATNLPSFRNW